MSNEPCSAAALTVSVVIPAYNAANTIVRAVSSALNQTQPPLEVIVVDDGSTDNTLAVCRAEFGQRVKVITQPNGGASAARNTGIRAATGDLICLLDADDVLYPTKIEVLVPALAAHPQCMGVSGWYDYVTETDRRECRLQRGADDEQVRVLPIYELLKLPVLDTNTMLFRRVFFEEVGGFNTTMRYAQDTELWCRMGAQSLWVYVDHATSCYYHLTATSRTRHRAYHESWPAMQAILDLRPQVLPELLPAYTQYVRHHIALPAVAMGMASGNDKLVRSGFAAAPCPCLFCEPVRFAFYMFLRVLWLLPKPLRMRIMELKNRVTIVGGKRGKSA